MCAEQLAGQQICMVAYSLAALYILASLAQNGVGLLPQLLGHYGGHDLAGLVLEHDPFLGREKLLLLREHVDHLDLVADIVALIFRI